MASTSSSENMPLHDQEASAEPSIQRQRPRFLRAITSPLPVLSAFIAQTAEESTSPHPYQPELTGSVKESVSADDIVESELQTTSTKSSRPQPAPLQQSASHNVSLRSFSSSLLASLLPLTSGSTVPVPMSPTSPSQPRISITDALLKERHWPKGQILNWMPGFTKGQYLDGFETYPSPITTGESARSFKSVQRHKPESTGYFPHSCGEDSNHLEGCAILGLDTISVSGNMCQDQNDQNVNHLKANDTRLKCISESGQGAFLSSPYPVTPPKSSGTGLAERLSGFAQGMRMRSSYMEGETIIPSSLISPNSPTIDPRNALIKHRSFSGGASFGRQHRQACLETEQAAEFNTWGDFLTPYGKGHFPNIQNQRHPQTRLEPEYPPLPDYARSANTKCTPSFLAAPLPPTEERRLKALYSYQILETGSDANFQRVAQLVSAVLGVSGCMICLVDHENVSVKAHYRAENMECRREVSLSGHAILRPPGDPLVVLDASRDWRFKNLPAVKGGPRVRFYAGASLATSDGHNIGSLCVIDTKPRTEFTDKEKAMLIDFAAVVMREMELWNDQVQLCTRTRMMRDITRWVRGCLGREPIHPSFSNSLLDSNSDKPTPSSNKLSGSAELDTVQSSTFSASPSGITGSNYMKPSYSTPASGPGLPTPTGSPTLLSTALKSRPNHQFTADTEKVHQDRLQDEAFPSACSMIQTTLNVDAVYLVQTSFNKSIIPISGSNVVWNYLGAEDRTSGFTGIVGGDESPQDTSSWRLACIACSKKLADADELSMSNVSIQGAHREGKSWICTDEGCRPHRLGELRPNAVDPLWSRDMPVISEILSYVRQEKSLSPPSPGKCPLFTCYQNSDDEDLSIVATEDLVHKSNQRKSILCHTFQGTLRELSTGYNSPYKSCVVMPIHGSSSASHTTSGSAEPWAYFVVLTSSHTKQFSVHERIYLKNFGSCLITEVLKRRIESADKAKGVFIKSISHELRTPLHIILGILELLYSNEDGNLSDQQLSMIASAEASGKGLIDIINNVIDLADLDPENNADSNNNHNGHKPLPEPFTQVAEIDIRELCEQVAGTMAKSCIDKNLVIVPTWTKPALASISSSVTTQTTAPSSNTSTRTWDSGPCLSSNRSSINGDMSSAESQYGLSGTGAHLDQKIDLELLVAMDEPESDPDQETPWSFMLNLPVIKRILTQLLENALKFTTTGFVEISAVSPPLSTFPLKPPTPESRPILFTVRDTGKGISPEFVQAHLFQRFSQEDPLQVGTGLGLALVKLLVESLGGWLEIWSEGVQGKGCVVRVLIWATPSRNAIKSLKDENGVWQEKSCRFYTGERTVSTDRLWKIMGERMMCQDFNMNVQRGNEQDISPEDMLKDLGDQSKCDLIILNDDLSRLKAYMSHWADQHTAAKIHGTTSSTVPIPLLMLTSISTAKKARSLVEAYRNTWKECDGIGCLANVVLMPKPIGPLKLMRCLHACLTESGDHLAGRYTSEPANDMETTQPTSIPLLRSATLPHITTMALGVHDTRQLSAGTMIKSSFKFPTSPATISGLGETSVPPHSPGGLVLPRFSISTNSDNTASPTQADGTLSKGKPVHEQNEAKPKLPRSIKNFKSQRNASSKTTNDSKKQPSALVNSGNSITSHQAKPLNSETTGQTLALNSAPRALIVEDNMTNRMILRTFLKKQGIIVVEAENGQLGVERFQEEVWRRQGRCGFEFVLMDIQMPVMDGNLATKRIREFELSMVKQHGLSMPEPLSPTRSHMVEEEPESEKRGYRPTTIFALTGLAGEEDKRLAFECGVDGYLTKPVNLKALGDLLSSCNPSNPNPCTTAN